MRYVVPNAALVLERLGAHAKRGGDDPSLFFDPDWLASGESISAEIENASKLLKIVYYSPDAEHLRPKVLELATLLEGVGVLYAESITMQDLDLALELTDFLNRINTVATEMGPPFQAVCSS